MGLLGGGGGRLTGGGGRLTGDGGGGGASLSRPCTLFDGGDLLASGGGGGGGTTPCTFFEGVDLLAGGGGGVSFLKDRTLGAALAFTPSSSANEESLSSLTGIREYSKTCVNGHSQKDRKLVSKRPIIA